MAKRLGKFELPKRLVKDEASATSTYGKYVAEPFETGFGHTIGNALRRVLLSSIEGAAISSIKIDGVDHEFQSIDGIVENTFLSIMGILFAPCEALGMYLYCKIGRRLCLKPSISRLSLLNSQVPHAFISASKPI